MKLKFSFLGIALMMCWSLSATTLIKQSGWFESAYITWENVAGASNYRVYYKATSASEWTKIDNELVRNYGSYGRADVLGLKAGNYQMKVVPVKSGVEVVAEQAISNELVVVAHDRAGFAHVGGDYESNGVGAYKNDGTLKDNALVIYVYGNNAKTVTASIMQDKAPVEFTGIQHILGALEKGKETRPICIRIIGTVKKADLDGTSSNEGLQVKGHGGINAQLTIEGVGEDATVHGFGFLVRNMDGVEFRNFGIMICLDDCLSLDTNNHHIWIHNMDFFYGGTGSDADQAKGDGVVDVKGKSSYITVGYNHFWDTGKSSLGGMKSETKDCVLTYHHNWFDHSDSRHPRIRTMFFHIYNNYFDGNAKYGVGMTMGGSALVERNYFRNCKYPMLISKQGTDATGDGTFSGEAGGVIVSYNNQIINPRRYNIHQKSTNIKGYDGKDYTINKSDANDWDSYEVKSLTEAIPSGITCAAGGTGYSNTAIPYTYVADEPADVKAKVMANAGRIGQGDFQWQFNNATQDENYAVITELKKALLDYQSKMVGFYGDELPTKVNNGGFTGEYPKGDSQKNEDYKPSYNGQGGDAEDPEDLRPIITGAEGDFYWFNEDNDANTLKLIEDGVITFNAESNYKPTNNGTNDKYTDAHTGSIQLSFYDSNKKKGTVPGAITFYCADSISMLHMHIFRTGSLKGEVQVSNDGSKFTKHADYSTKAAGAYVQAYSFSTPVKYVRVTNTATGSMHVHGIRLYGPGKEDTPTAIESIYESQPKATKVLRNGQLLIIRDGVAYTTTGQVVR